jgi:hypothetical protein
MKKYLFFLLLMFLFAGKSFAQFSLDKFLSEKLVVPDREMQVDMEKLMKSAVDAKLDKIEIKVASAKAKSGRTAIQFIANAKLTDKEALKLNNLLKKRLTEKLGTVSKETVINGVKDNLWLIKDGTRYMLTYSGNLTMLLIMKK